MLGLYSKDELEPKQAAQATHLSLVRTKQKHAGSNMSIDSGELSKVQRNTTGIKYHVIAHLPNTCFLVKALHCSRNTMVKVMYGPVRMNDGVKPFHRASGPSALAVLAMQSNMPV